MGHTEGLLITFSMYCLRYQNINLKRIVMLMILPLVEKNPQWQKISKSSSSERSFSTRNEDIENVDFFTYLGSELNE